MNAENKLYVYGINGPIVTVPGETPLGMSEMVYVGKDRLIGEVIRIDSEKTVIQVYENTAGLAPGAEVEPTGAPMSVMLGPGLIGGIYDGVGKPLTAMAKGGSPFLSRGISLDTLDLEREWQISVTVRTGDTLRAGDVYAECDETQSVRHRCIVPSGLEGVVTFAAPDGNYKVGDTVLKLSDADGAERCLTLFSRWPIRTPRPISEREPISEPLVTGQRIIDTMFPIAKGGCAAVPGGFGTGKTVIQHQLAKWCDADIIIYVGCGERGNEMTQALNEFTELKDPRNGRPLLERTILIANTSNMPVAAREASIYTGITIAEYYRDMGFNTALMADSTSRWAEALREISGRLEEMPADEGYPAYLPSRLSEFYERAGSVRTLGGKSGSVTLIGAVSPQGADFSEPVTQNTKRFIRCFWALDKSLAYARHYPSVNWNDSYSEYAAELADWYGRNIGEDFIACRSRLLSLLAEENSLLEIVKLIGSELLSDDKKLILETARVIRSGFLQQNALDAHDTFMPLPEHLEVMRCILTLYDCAAKSVARQAPVSRILATGLFDRAVRLKNDVAQGDTKGYETFRAEAEKKLAAL